MRSRLRAVLAMLCVAVAVVFAGASAASVVDRVQHDAHVVHDHTVHVGLTGVDYDHHDDSDHPDDSAAPDQPPGLGHHHADAPAGALDDGAQFSVAATGTLVTLRSPASISLPGIRPGGFERPPRSFAKLV